MGIAVEELVVLEDEVVAAALVVLVSTNVEVAVGPAVEVELERGKLQLVEVEVTVEVRPGQLVTVGLHWVTVMVWVRVWVDVVVMSPSSAATSTRLVARTAMMLLNCMVSDCLVTGIGWTETFDVVGVLVDQRPRV